MTNRIAAEGATRRRHTSERARDRAAANVDTDTV
jgi:hypothetical protein